MAIETISILDALGAQKAVLADLIGSSYGQVLKVAFGTDGALTLVEPTVGLPVEILLSDVTLPVQPAMATSGAAASVAASASSVTLKTANANRKSIVIYNNSTADLYIRTEAAPASTSTFTLKLIGGGIYEDYGYTGEIRGIWASATGNAMVTERV